MDVTEPIESQKVLCIKPASILPPIVVTAIIFALILAIFILFEMDADSGFFFAHNTAAFFLVLIIIRSGKRMLREFLWQDAFIVIGVVSNWLGSVISPVDSSIGTSLYLLDILLDRGGWTMFVLGYLALLTWTPIRDGLPARIFRYQRYITIGLLTYFSIYVFTPIATVALPGLSSKLMLQAFINIELTMYILLAGAGVQFFSTRRWPSLLQLAAMLTMVIELIAMRAFGKIAPSTQISIFSQSPVPQIMIVLFAMIWTTFAIGFYYANYALEGQDNPDAGEQDST